MISFHSFFFNMIAKEFPENVATMFAILETFFGIGMIVGPTVRGALYEAGGFTLPFVLLGSILCCASGFCYFVLPSSVDSVNSVTEKPSVLQALKVSNKITVVEFQPAHLVQGKVHFDPYTVAAHLEGLCLRIFVLPSSVDSVNSVPEKPSVLQALKVSNKITVVEFHAAHLLQGSF